MRDSFDSKIKTNTNTKAVQLQQRVGPPPATILAATRHRVDETLDVVLKLMSPHILSSHSKSYIEQLGHAWHFNWFHTCCMEENTGDVAGHGRFRI
ncbi:hypothetical protein HNY73_001126 [Argiope bruennichi]|uniref:Uncharacterized protein n=1 Tax=Argiope bruennichi TaxID=94029 RepID=A0A8T0G1L9_ARGBR|nr:hypothetical protein HNY73_001126 [Argiope bruennichi]